MGNSSSKTQGKSILSDKDLSKLHKCIIKEYPHVDGIEKSCLITNNRKEDCPIIYVGNNFSKMTQYEEKEVLGFNCRFLQGKHTNQKTVDEIRNAIKTGSKINVEILNYRKDGTPFLNNFTLLPLHTKSNSSLVTHYLAIQKDITFTMQEVNIKKWKSCQVAIWMEFVGFEVITPFIENNIEGHGLLTINTKKLSKIGISDSQIQESLLSLIKDLKTSGPKFGEYNQTEPTLKSLKRDSSFDNDIKYISSSPYKVKRRRSFTSSFSPRKSLQSRINANKNTENTLYLNVDRQIKLNGHLWDGKKLGKDITIKIYPNASFLYFRNSIQCKFNIDKFSVNIYNRSISEWCEIESQKQFNNYLINSKTRSIDIRIITNSNNNENITETIPNNKSTSEILGNTLKINLLVPNSQVQQRTMIYDTMICDTMIKNNKHISTSLHSVNNIWETLENINNENDDNCFIIPMSIRGRVHKDIPKQFRKKCNTLFESILHENFGDIPYGSIFFGYIENILVIFTVILSCNTKLYLPPYRTYYTAFRNILKSISKYNISNENVIWISDKQTKNKEITNITFPTYFSSIFNKAYDIPETIKFGYESSIAIKAFFKWRSSNITTVKHQRKFTSSIEKRLTRDHYLYYKNNKEKHFLDLISSGDLAIRGVVDYEEMNWLVEACGYTGSPTSKFTGNRRLQRLASIAIVSLLTNEYFTTSVSFQNLLCDTIINNRDCINWLLKMVSVESIHFHNIIDIANIHDIKPFDKGATSSLYHGIWNNEQVAVKIFYNGMDRSLILKEITLMGLLKHPNILPIYGWGITDSSIGIGENRDFLVCPYMSRGSLFDVIKKKLPEFDFMKRYNAIMNIARGLQYLHNKDLIHRDLKSKNILVNENYNAYIADVGATRLEEIGNMTHNTGTLSWMAPEMFKETKSYTKQVDIYSFGMIIYEIITNKIPFENLKFHQVPSAIMKGVRPTLPQDTPKPWIKLMHSMWHQKPNKRPQIEDIIQSISQLSNEKFIVL